MIGGDGINDESNKTVPPKRLRIIEAKHPLPSAIVSGGPSNLVGLKRRASR